MSTLTDRTFHCRTGADDRLAFARDVVAGLSTPQKTLPGRHALDQEGTRLFDGLTSRPEHYLSRSETEVLKEHGDDIASAAGPGVRVVELACGDGARTRVFLEAMLRRHHQATYTPIDVSEAPIRAVATRLLHSLKNLVIDAHVGAFDDGLDRAFADEPAPTLVALLGSALGRFHRGDALAFLSRLRRRARPFDHFLLGLDLQKDESLLNAAYNDSAGFAARLNLNLLSRINRELGGTFDPAGFEHLASYNARDGRVEIHLRSVRPQVVRIESLDRYFAFEEGETIWTESSYAYSPWQIAEMCALTGWTPVHRWVDAKRFVSVLLLAPAPGRGIAADFAGRVAV